MKPCVVAWLHRKRQRRVYSHQSTTVQPQILLLADSSYSLNTSPLPSEFRHSLISSTGSLFICRTFRGGKSVYIILAVAVPPDCAGGQRAARIYSFIASIHCTRANCYFVKSWLEKFKFCFYTLLRIIMASLFKDPNKLSAYKDRRFQGTQEDFEHALKTSTTVYIGNMSFYTTEEQVYELFSRVGELKKIIMGLDKNTKTPCGFCFVLFYSREDAEDAVKYISGTILDDRPIRVDFDWGFQEGRQWGRGRSGGQVRDEYRTDYDPGRGGYGKLVQRELEVQRQLVDYGTGSLGTFPPAVPSHYGRRGGFHGPSGSYRHGRDYQRKRQREDDRPAGEMSKRTSEHEHGRHPADHESRPEKNPRFRESGDSDDEEDDDQKRRP